MLRVALLGWSLAELCTGWTATAPQMHASRMPASLSPLRLSADAPASEERLTAIVTGGSGGIGLAVCHRLAARGSNVVIAYGHNDAKATAACEQLRATHGIQAVAVKGDLTIESARTATVDALFEAVDEVGANVSAFVHAAGYFDDELLSHHLDGGMSDFEVYDAYQSIYPKAFVAIAERALTRMGAGGRMVAITNPGCNSAQTPRIGYDMPGQGKATMEFAVRMYAARVAKRGICVNAVSPGYTDTGAHTCARGHDREWS